MLTCLIASIGCCLSSTIQIHKNVSYKDTNDWMLQKEIPVHKCMMQCVHKDCHLVSYRQQDETCLMSERQCMVLELRPGFVSQAAMISPASDVPSRLAEIPSACVTIAIVKFTHQYLLPGQLEKITTPGVYSLYNRHWMCFVADSTVAFFAVHLMRSLISLPYSAIPPGPLPYLAVISSWKQDGSPLYPAKSFITVPQTQ